MQNNSISIAITGNIASGKSYVLKCFKMFGFKVFDFDSMVRNLLQQDLKLIKFIELNFKDCVDSNNRVDRVMLSRVVFENKSKLALLERAIHPRLINLQDEILSTANCNTAFEIPLLFEKWDNGAFDYTVLVYCNRKKAKDRAMQRSPLTEELFLSILSNQMPDILKLEKVDYAIYNSLSKVYTFACVKKIIQNIYGKANSSRYRDYRSKSRRWPQNY